MEKTKKLFIKTYGCQMNVYDSERMSEALGEDGYLDYVFEKSQEIYSFDEISSKFKEKLQMK